MDDGFLLRILRTSFFLSLGLGVVVAFYFGPSNGIAFGVSGLWGTMGLGLLRAFLYTVTGAHSPFWKVALIGFLKFPLLYGGGLMLLYKFRPNLLAVFAGLTLVLAVIVLKHLGKAMVESEWFTRPIAGEGTKS